MSVTYPIKQIVNISRPGEPPDTGDHVEIETIGGFIMAVDPQTRQSTTEHKRFVITSDGGIMPIPEPIRGGWDIRLGRSPNGSFYTVSLKRKRSHG